MAEVFRPPLTTEVVDNKNIITEPWSQFFSLLKDRLDPMGVEKTFELVNNQAAYANITGLSFNSTVLKHAIIEYFVQRVTTGGGAVELHEAGVLRAVWQQTSATWAISQGDAAPDDAGITFGIATSGTVGNVQYQTTNETGTASVSKISYRVRTMAG